MFYDERIELAKGKICRNSIIISLVLSLMIGILRLGLVTSRFTSATYVYLIAIEVIIALCSAITLIIGAIRSRHREKDERFIAEQSCFYIKAAYICLNIVIICEAVIIPVKLHLYQRFGGSVRLLVYDTFLFLLFFVICNYIIYSFKKNDIYLNYHLMEDDHYYTGVWKNIGKLSVRALYCLGISMTADLMLDLFTGTVTFNIIEAYIIFFFIYVSFTATLAVLYLLYSFLEKSSYNSERLVSKATVISLLITIFIYALYACFIVYISMLPISQSEIYMEVSQMSTICSNILIFTILMFLTYFGYEYQKKKPNRLLSAALLTIILSFVLSEISSYVYSHIQYMLLDTLLNSNSYELIQTMANILNCKSDLVCITNSVGFILTVIALIKDRSIGKGHIASVGFLGILWALDIFIRTQLPYIYVTYFGVFANVSILICLWAIILSVSSRDKKSLDKTEPM